jgi:hypothetical protein
MEPMIAAELLRIVKGLVSDIARYRYALAECASCNPDSANIARVALAETPMGDTQEYAERFIARAEGR